MVIPHAEGTVALTIGTTTLSAATVSGEKRPKQINAGRCLPLPVSSCLEWARDFFWPEVRLGQVEQGEAGEVQRRSVRFKLIVLYTMVHCCPPYIAFWNHTLQPTMQWNTLHDTTEPHIHIALHVREHLCPHDAFQGVFGLTFLFSHWVTSWIQKLLLQSKSQPWTNVDSFT